jgi:methionyl-tRNA synthetase
VTAVGFGTDAALFERHWPADLHVIGKDITRFHAVIWPALLMSAGVALPTQVFGHGWLHLKGEKMSKSLGTTIEPLDAIERFGPDPLRLYLVKEISFGSDGDFTWDRFEERYNVDLANNLGNLVSRLAAMAHKYRDGQLQPSADGPGPLRGVAARALEDYRHAMDALALEGGVAAAFAIIDGANEYIASTEPWALAREASNAGRLSQVLFDIAEAVRIAAVLLLPVMPRSAAEVLRRVGERRSAHEIRLDDAAWQPVGERLIRQGDALWPRIVPAMPAVSTFAVPTPSVVRSNPVSETNPTPAQAATSDGKIALDDFMKVDLRVAKVLAAEKVANSRKLVKLSVDVGAEQRTLVAGIAEAYEPEQLVGRTIVMVFNLKPAKLMGIESNGMVLAASPDGGKPTLVGFDQDIPPGTRVR